MRIGGAATLPRPRCTVRAFASMSSGPVQESMVSQAAAPAFIAPVATLQEVAVGQGVLADLALDAACYHAMQDLTGAKPRYTSDDLAAAFARRRAASPLAPCPRLPLVSRAFSVDGGAGLAKRLQGVWGA